MLIDIKPFPTKARKKARSKWAKQNREKINARIRKDYALNPEKYKARCRKFYELKRAAQIHIL